MIGEHRTDSISRLRTGFRWALMAASLAASVPELYAGQLYGSITSAGKPASGTAVSITCSGQETKTTTGADGAYRANVAQEGRCTLALPSYAGAPSVLVFSHDKPALYDLELVRKSDGNYELKIR
jgi:hypothetical protein